MILNFIYIVSLLWTISLQEKENLIAIHNDSYRAIKGSVTTFDAQPIEGAILFVDYKQTSAETNKKGKFSLKLDGRIKLITVYHTDFGLISWQNDGKRNLKFIYPEASEPLTIEELEKLGFMFEPEKTEERKWYADFDSDWVILRSRRLPNVRVNNGK